MSILRLSIVLMLGTMLLAIPSCNREKSESQPSPATNNTTIGLTQSSSMIKLSLEELTNRASLITLGSVNKIVSQKDAQGNIFTLNIFAIEQILKGQATGEIVINTPGGTIDRYTLLVEDAASFQTDERYIVFLTNSGNQYNVVGGFQGKFPIDNNNMVGNMTLQQFVNLITSYLSR